MSRRRNNISYVGLDQSDSDNDFADHIPDILTRPPSSSRLKRSEQPAVNDSPQAPPRVSLQASPERPQEDTVMSPKGVVVPDTSDESTPRPAGSDAEADAEPEVSPARAPARTPAPARDNDDAIRSESSFDPDDAQCSDSDFSDPEPEPKAPSPPKAKKRVPAKAATSSKAKAKPKATTKSKASTGGVGAGRVSKPARKPAATTRASGGLKQRRAGSSIAIPTSVPRVPGATGRRPRRVGLSRNANVPRLLKSYKG